LKSDDIGGGVSRLYNFLDDDSIFRMGGDYFLFEKCNYFIFSAA
jgi:hypothetical protein